MPKLKRTNSSDPDFVELVKQLDAYLTVVDGEDHAFYNQYNKIAKIKNVVVAYLDSKPVGCGCIKPFAPGVVEVKRMFTLPECRGKGIASAILSELEDWAAELSNHKCVLETGKRQVEAVGFYQKAGYKRIPNFGQYAGVSNSLCFEKQVGGNV